MKPEMTQEQMQQLVAAISAAALMGEIEGIRAAIRKAHTLGWKARQERDAELCEALNKVGFASNHQCAEVIRKEN